MKCGGRKRKRRALEALAARRKWCWIKDMWSNKKLALGRYRCPGCLTKSLQESTYGFPWLICDVCRRLSAMRCDQTIRLEG